MASNEPIYFSLIPPFGRGAHLTIAGVLKLGRGATLAATHSEIVFFDAHAREVGRLADAFRLSLRTQLQSPSCQVLRDERSPPHRAVTMQWNLDDEASPAVAATRDDAARDSLCAVYFPSQVPVREDVDVLVRYVNRGTERVNVLDGVRSAVHWADGVPCPSITGWHWDGPYLAPLGCTSALRFRLADFRGAPVDGEHECSVELLGMRTSPERVSWTGEPWSRSR